MTTDEIIRSPRTVPLGLAIAALFVSLTITALATASFLLYRQTVYLRNTFCGFTTPIAALGELPRGPEPTTDTGRSFSVKIEGITNGAAVTSAKLGCPGFGEPPK